MNTKKNYIARDNMAKEDLKKDEKKTPQETREEKASVKEEVKEQEQKTEEKVEVKTEEKAEERTEEKPETKENEAQEEKKEEPKEKEVPQEEKESESETKVEEVKEPEGESGGAEALDKSETTEAKGDVKEEKKSRFAFWKRKKKDKKEEVKPKEEVKKADVTEVVDEDGDEKISAGEAVNAIDPENKVIKEAALAKELDEQLIEETRDEYFQIRIKKSVLLLLLGLGIVAMWVVPLIKGASWLKSQMESKEAQTPTQEVAEENSQPEAETAEEAVRVRIKNSSGDQGLGEQIAVTITQAGFEEVELMSDEEAVYEGISVVAKPQAEEIKAQVVEALESEWELASSSATLSQDSDFSVVVLVGN